MSEGVLYVVATPMGNLDDVTYRAIRILSEVDLIAAEDTRRSRVLLERHGILTPMLALHEHNEQARVRPLLAKLHAGSSIALISDAGTPMISDPGFPLVREAARQRLRVVPVPGPCAAICALSAAGLPTDRFLFAGFPPRQGTQRRRWLEALANEAATLVLYESSHRILATLGDLLAVCGAERPAVVAREMTKLHETFLSGSLGELLQMMQRDLDQQRGEFVVLIQGYTSGAKQQVSLELESLLRILIKWLPVKQAAGIAADLTGHSKNALYQKILAIKAENA